MLSQLFKELKAIWRVFCPNHFDQGVQRHESWFFGHLGYLDIVYEDQFLAAQNILQYKLFTEPVKTNI